MGIETRNFVDIIHSSPYHNNSEQLMLKKIPFAHHWRLISDWLENIARLPEASNKCPARK